MKYTKNLLYIMLSAMLVILSPYSFVSCTKKQVDKPVSLTAEDRAVADSVDKAVASQADVTALIDQEDMEDEAGDTPEYAESTLQILPDEQSQMDIPVFAPLFSQASGVYASAVRVSIEANPKEAIIVYSTDGSSPTPNRGSRYTGPINVSSSAIIKAIAYLPEGRVSSVGSSDYTIAEICVAAGGKGDGTRSRPLGSIVEAMKKAQSLSIQEIKLAVGNYSEKLDILSQVSISGGWNTAFTAQGGQRSRIVSPEQDGRGSKQDPVYTIRIDGARQDSSVILSRLEICGPEATYSTGILVSGNASPLIRDSEACAGFSSYGYGAMVLSGARPVFSFTKLHGGEGASSFGLSVDSATVTVKNSWLLAGTGTVSGTGLSATDASVRVYSSVLAGNNANTVYGAALYNCKESRFEFCTIIGGTGREATGLFISEARPSISACIIASWGSVKSYGIVANYGNSSPALLENTVFLSSETGLYYDNDKKLPYTKTDSSGNLVSAGGQSLSAPVAVFCSKGNFVLGPAPDYRTPKNAGISAAKEGSADASLDMDGRQRQTPWVPGAWQ